MEQESYTVDIMNGSIIMVVKGIKKNKVVELSSEIKLEEVDE